MAWGFALIISLGSLMLLGYYSRHYVDQSTPLGIPPAVDAIRRLTAANSVLVVLGVKGSPFLPYYADRRAIIDDLPLPLEDGRLRQAMLALRGERVGAVVVSGSFRGLPRLLAPRLTFFGCSDRPAYSDAQVDIYLPADR